VVTSLTTGSGGLGCVLDGEKLTQAKQIIDLALDLAKDCAASHRKARPEIRKCGTEPFSARSELATARSPEVGYEEPFSSLLGSHKGSMVEVRGLHPPL
jgi:hypothetical protein